jgi:hypothetical protein
MQGKFTPSFGGTAGKRVNPYNSQSRAADTPVYLLGQKGELGVGASREGACCIGVLHYY